VGDVVLVHGTTQSAAGFGGLAAALRELGHRVVAPQIPCGAADSAIAYADLLADALPEGLREPVVVAHSAGGLLLPALAARLGARHQVWLAAAVADHAGGRGFRQELRADPPAVVNPDWIGVDPTTDHEKAASFLFHDADPEQLRVALDTLAVCDIATVYEEVPTLDPAVLPSTYLLPTGDRTLRPAWMARVARERLGVEPLELPGASHNFYVAIPARTAELIDTAAR
jgi:pimeloyl-ACP methyl ester carboxylesterase